MDATLVPNRQRGAAALVVTALLFFAMLLVVAAANRSVLVEARSSANQYRSTQAFQAAEAGLEWAVAKLNDDTPLGDDCLPSNAVGAASFRDRRLQFNSSLASLVPMTWDDGGTARPLQATCVRGDAGWSCRCPATGVATAPPVAGTTTAPMFTVELSAAARPGLIVAVATGCTGSTTSCGPTSDTSHEAAARVEVSLGLLPGLRTLPAAALTASGDVDAGAAALGLHHADAAFGKAAVDAGGGVTGNSLRLYGAAGSALDAAIASGDTALAGLDDAHFFRHWFGMDAARWSAQPAVQRIVCTGGCTGAVLAAVARGQRLISVDGALSLDGPVALGTAERPIVLVVSGPLRLTGAVALSGLVFAAGIEWNDAPSDAWVRGALLSRGAYRGNAAADFIHDPQVLARLHGGTGTFVRVDASWKDF
jgi:hypothetical protein